MGLKTRDRSHFLTPPDPRQPITSVTCAPLPVCTTLEWYLQELRIYTAATTKRDDRNASARAFIHSLNILVKYVRLYGFEHKRTEAQFEITWKELQQGLPKDAEGGFLLGVSGNKLLLDGVPLGTGQAEQSFAQLLTAAGLASISFSNQVSVCLLYTSPSPRDGLLSRMPSSA